MYPDSDMTISCLLEVHVYNRTTFQCLVLCLTEFSQITAAE